MKLNLLILYIILNIYIYIYELSKASDTQAVERGFKSRPDH